MDHFKDSVGSIVAYLPYDYKKQALGRYACDWKWHALPVKPSMLSDAGKTGGEKLLVNHHRAGAAKHNRYSSRPLSLIASASDKACEVLGSGCISPETASLSYGTTATINTNNVNYVEPQAFIPPYPSAIPDNFNSEVMIYRGFWMVNWFKQEFGQNEID